MRNTTALILFGGVLAAGMYWQWRSRNRYARLEQLESGDPKLLSFELSGHVGQAEIRAMAEAVLDGFERFDEIDMLVLLPRFTGMSPGAAVDLKGMQAGLLSLGKVRRYAVVAPPAWADAMITFGDLIIPVEARTFPIEALQEAREWVTADREAPAVVA